MHRHQDLSPSDASPLLPPPPPLSWWGRQITRLDDRAARGKTEPPAKLPVRSNWTVTLHVSE